MTPLRVALAGLGALAADMAQAVRGCEQLELYALCSRDTAKLARLAEEWSVPAVFPSYDELLRDAAVDAVMVLTPNHLHADMAVAALEAGKHVLCTKPPARTAAEAERMAAAARASGRLLMYGLPYRFSRKHEMVRGLREQGLFGEVYYGRAGILRRCGNPGGWFSSVAHAGGGPLVDLGVHIIDLAMLTMGDFEPVSIFARTFRKTENLGTVQYHRPAWASAGEGFPDDAEELAALMLNAKNGACLQVEVSFTSHIPEDAFHFSMLGSRGGAEIDPELRFSTTLHGVLMNLHPQVDCERFDRRQALADEVQNFARSALGEAKCLAPPETGVTLMRVVEAGYRSARSGRVELI